MQKVSIPTPQIERLNEFDAAVCPSCGVWIVLKEIIEDKFTQKEFKSHYKGAHLRKK